MRYHTSRTQEMRPMYVVHPLRGLRPPNRHIMYLIIQNRNYILQHSCRHTLFLIFPQTLSPRESLNFTHTTKTLLVENLLELRWINHQYCKSHKNEHIVVPKFFLIQEWEPFSFFYGHAITNLSKARGCGFTCSPNQQPQGAFNSFNTPRNTLNT